MMGKQLGGLCLHFMKGMLADADQVIHDTKYYGEKKSFGFEAYTQKFYATY